MEESLNFAPNIYPVTTESAFADHALPSAVIFVLPLVSKQFCAKFAADDVGFWFWFGLQIENHRSLDIFLPPASVTIVLWSIKRLD